jgi:hypothetical protein
VKPRYVDYLRRDRRLSLATRLRRFGWLLESARVRHAWRESPEGKRERAVMVDVFGDCLLRSFHDALFPNLRYPG